MDTGIHLVPSANEASPRESQRWVVSAPTAVCIGNDRDPSLRRQMDVLVPLLGEHKHGQPARSKAPRTCLWKEPRCDLKITMHGVVLPQLDPPCHARPLHSRMHWPG
eukprot:scaffold113_cov339-Pavlova_lutheri.AAC.41